MEDCGCDKKETTQKVFLFPNKDTVGEEIFDDSDIFEKVKNYYQNYSKDEGDYLEEDLLLDDLNIENNKKEIEFINELYNYSNDYNVITLEEKQINVNNEPVILKQIENEKKDLINVEKERKIKYIKNYLKKLKDGL